VRGRTQRRDKPDLHCGHASGDSRPQHRRVRHRLRLTPRIGLRPSRDRPRHGRWPLRPPDRGRPARHAHDRARRERGRDGKGVTPGRPRRCASERAVRGGGGGAPTVDAVRPGRGPYRPLPVGIAAARRSGLRRRGAGRARRAARAGRRGHGPDVGGPARRRAAGASGRRPCPRVCTAPPPPGRSTGGHTGGGGGDTLVVG
jgi:hypothetical protein